MTPDEKIGRRLRIMHDAYKIRMTVRWLAEIHQEADDITIREHLRTAIAGLSFAADEMDKVTKL